MAITTDQVKSLRDQTGISVMQCKQALEEAGGDMEKALLILSKKGTAVAGKKAGRTLNAGAISAYIHAGGTVGAMVELLCESDFVAKNEEFKAFAYDLAMQVAATNPEYLSVNDIPDDMKQKAEDLFKPEVAGKPENLQEQILKGKMDAYFKDRVLLTQDLIKDPETTVTARIDSVIQKFGEKIEIGRFARFSTLGR